MLEIPMRNTTLIAILVAIITVGGIFYIFVTNVWSTDYVTVEINTQDRIMIETRIGSSNPKQLFTYGKTNTVFVEQKGNYNVIISVRKITDEDNPVNVTIIDQDSKILFIHTFLKSEIKINLDEIIRTRALNY